MTLGRKGNFISVCPLRNFAVLALLASDESQKKLFDVIPISRFMMIHLKNIKTLFGHDFKETL
jgi:hypothetical protein